MISDYNIDGVAVTASFEITEDEAGAYVKYALDKYPHTAAIQLTLSEDDMVGMLIKEEHRPFERIRRITGYLVGTVDRWNGGKKAELKDRVKHSCTE